MSIRVMMIMMMIYNDDENNNNNNNINIHKTIMLTSFLTLGVLVVIKCSEKCACHDWSE